MKKIITSILILTLLSGCQSYSTEEKVCEECEDCSADKLKIIELNAEITRFNNSIGNNINSTTNQSIVYISDCTTCTRLLNNKEKALEDCWMENDDNEYKDLYRDCRDDRDVLKDDIDDLEVDKDNLDDELAECFTDLESCEDD